MEVGYLIDPARKGIIFSLPLLNPSDYIRFSILTTADNTNVQASARIAGVSGVRSITALSDEPVRRPLSWQVYAVGFVTAFLGLIFLVGLHRLGGEELLAAAVTSGTLIVPDFQTIMEYESWVTGPLLKWKAVELKKIEKSYSGIPRGNALTATQRSDLASRIRRALTTTQAATGAVITMGLLVVIGAVYTSIRVFNR